MTNAAIQDVDADIVRTGIPAIEGERSEWRIGGLRCIAIGLKHGVVLEMIRLIVAAVCVVRSKTRTCSCVSSAGEVRCTGQVATRNA
jgi:hypothetical protein